MKLVLFLLLRDVGKFLLINAEEVFFETIIELIEPFKKTTFLRNSSSIGRDAPR